MDNHLERLVVRYPALADMKASIAAAVDMLEACYRNGGRILVCGNGGSASDAEHIVGELMKGFLLPRPLSDEETARLRTAGAGAGLLHGLQRPISAISLAGGVALPTAFANDMSPENVFAQQVLGLGRPGDVCWGISTSGKSGNIIAALRVARAFGLSTLGLTRHGGTPMDALCDVVLGVPADTTPDIQELHLPVYHAICAQLEARLFT